MKKNEQITSPLKAIRANCIQCIGSYNEVKKCTAEKTCHLWSFRFGKNPFRKKRELTEEQRKTMAKRLQKVRDKKGKK